MVEEVIRYLTSNCSEDYWYDEGIFICDEIIEQMSETDWDMLGKSLLMMDVQSKVRLAECLADVSSTNSTEILIKLCSIDEGNLFVVCIDSLRDKELKKINDDDKSMILKRIDDKLMNCTKIEKRIYDDFLLKHT